jgi:hypothetical protein
MRKPSSQTSPTLLMVGLGFANAVTTNGGLVNEQEGVVGKEDIVAITRYVPTVVTFIEGVVPTSTQVLPELLCQRCVGGVETRGWIEFAVSVALPPGEQNGPVDSILTL